MNLVAFKAIAGVPIHYARAPVAPYGTIGRPRTVRLDAVFKDQLETCLAQLWSVCPYGAPAALVSGGCYVKKAGRHGEGVAIDIDAIWWASTGDLADGEPKPLITKNAPNDAVRYLGVEAVLRKHFGTVLNYWFGHGHEDHWHVDSGQPQGWTGKPPTVHAETLFLQAALKHVHLCTNRDGSELEIDGKLGAETLAALSYAFAFDVRKEVVNNYWDEFLRRTWERAFEIGKSL